MFITNQHFSTYQPTILCFGQELEKCKRKQTFTCLNNTELFVPNAIMILKTCIFGFTFSDTSFGSYNWASTDDMHDDKLILLEFLAVAIRSIMPCLKSRLQHLIIDINFWLLRYCFLFLPPPFHRLKIIKTNENFAFFHHSLFFSLQGEEVIMRFAGGLTASK